MSEDRSRPGAYDVVIPVYRPDVRLQKAIRRLYAQTVKPGRIILMWTLSGEEDERDKADVLKSSYPDTRIYFLRKKDFDHAGTRNEGAEKTDAGHILFMTQDAVPLRRDMAERLLRAFYAGDEKEQGAGDRPRIAAAYARQTAGKDAHPEERYARRFNYPARSMIKTLRDEARLGIKTYFCSNVCAMYDREIYEELKGFKEPALFNEDMVFAAAALRRGYAICYQADAVVIHSHDYDWRQQYARSRDTGRSQAAHPEIFERVSSEKEGIKFVKGTLTYLIQSNRPDRIGVFLLHCAARYLGYRAGKRDKDRGKINLS